MYLTVLSIANILFFIKELLLDLIALIILIAATVIGFLCNRAVFNRPGESGLLPELSFLHFWYILSAICSVPPRSP